jgi:hypothetical protein
MTCSYAPSPHVMVAYYRSPTPVGFAGYAAPRLSVEARDYRMVASAIEPAIHDARRWELRL